MVLFFPEAALWPLSAGTPRTACLSLEHCGFGRECQGSAVQDPQRVALNLPTPRAGALRPCAAFQPADSGGSPGGGKASGHRRVCSLKTTLGFLLERFPISTEITGHCPRPPCEDFLEVGAGGGAEGGLACGPVVSFQVVGVGGRFGSSIS